MYTMGHEPLVLLTVAVFQSLHTNATRFACAKSKKYPATVVGITTPCRNAIVEFVFAAAGIEHSPPKGHGTHASPLGL